MLDPEVLLASQPGLPYGGLWRGHSGMEDFLAAGETSLVRLNLVRDGLVSEFRPYYWDPAAVSALFCEATHGQGWTGPVELGGRRGGNVGGRR